MQFLKDASTSYPGLQKHENEPTEFKQFPLVQGEPDVHSSISADQDIIVFTVLYIQERHVFILKIIHCYQRKWNKQPYKSNCIAIKVLSAV